MASSARQRSSRLIAIAAASSALLVLASYSSAIAAPPPEPSCRTVDQAYAEHPTDWLRRVESVGGLGQLCLQFVNETAFDMCHEMWDGADYDKMINRMVGAGVSPTRSQILALYSVAMGWTCNQAPGAPLGMPKT